MEWITQSEQKLRIPKTNSALHTLCAIADGAISVHVFYNIFVHYMASTPYGYIRDVKTSTSYLVFHR